MKVERTSGAAVPHHLKAGEFRHRIAHDECKMKETILYKFPITHNKTFKQRKIFRNKEAHPNVEQMIIHERLRNC